MGTPLLARVLGRARALLEAFGPAMARPKPMEALRSGLGAGLGLAATGLALEAARRGFGLGPGLSLIAPLGATGFLVFAAPNSPLAQPWSAVVGNCVSAAAAVCALRLGLGPQATAGAAVCGAALGMSALRALHPPGAAVALLAALSASAGARPDFSFVLAPVLTGTTAVVALGMLYNRLTGRAYPAPRHPPGRHGAADPPPERRLGLSEEELAAALERFELSANISAEDLGRVLAAAEEEAARRRFGRLVCADIMSRDVVSIRPDARLGAIADIFREKGFKTLPVTDAQGLLLGIVTQNDLIQRARADALGRGLRFAGAMRGLVDAARGGGLRARDIMSPPLRTLRPQDGLGALIALLADGGAQAAPIVEEGRLKGLVTRSDLLGLLARGAPPPAEEGASPQASAMLAARAERL